MSFSKISLFFSCIVLTIICLAYYPKWKIEGTEGTISWDVSGYYWYLPATFIYKDLRKLGFSDKIREKYRPTPNNVQSFTHANGNQVLKYSSGLSVLMLPGFVAGHTTAGILGYEQDGFSRPYQFGIFLWGLIVSLIGLFILRSVLLRYFSDTATGVTILAICFATNFTEYGFITNAMTHNFLFTMYAMLLWLTVRFYERPSFGTAAGIGLTAGLMALTRPTEIVAVLIPLTYGIVANFRSVADRIMLVARQYEKMTVAAVIAGTVGSIQLIYWKYVSGSWFVYSYEDQGFSWLRPHVYDCLFSGRAGWLVYTPVMVLSLIGFYHLYKKHKNLFPAIFFFSILFLYITFAWDIWWYGGSVSQRALVQIYPVLAFPFAAFTEAALVTRVRSVVFAVFGLFCVYYNLWMTHHCHKGGLFVAGDMTAEYLKAIFLRNSEPAEARKLLDTRKVYRGEIKNPVYLLNHTDTISGLSPACVSDSVQYSAARRFKLPSGKGWLRASGYFLTGDKEWDQWKMTQLTLKYFKGGKEIRSDILRVQRHLEPNVKTKLWLDSKLRKEPDEVEVFLWNSDGKYKVCADSLSVLYHAD